VTQEKKPSSFAPSNYRERKERGWGWWWIKGIIERQSDDKRATPAFYKKNRRDQKKFPVGGVNGNGQDMHTFITSKTDK
jgi:predicted alpha-1,6-mannanase (GH76 family)